MEPESTLPCSQKPDNSEALVKELLAPRPIPKLEDHLLSALNYTSRLNADCSV